MNDDSLPSFDIQTSIPGRDSHLPAQDQRILVEIGSLPRLSPTARALHAGNAQLLTLGVNAANKLFDQFGLVARRLNHRGNLDECRQGPLLSKRKFRIWSIPTKARGAFTWCA